MGGCTPPDISQHEVIIDPIYSLNTCFLFCMIHLCVLFQKKLKMFVFRSIYQIIVPPQRQLTFFGSCPDLHFLLNVLVWNTSHYGTKMGCKPLFEHFFLVFSSGAVCTQWQWCINRLMWSDPEIGQAVWLPLTEMKTSIGGLLCADMFILLRCELRISEEIQDKAVICLHHHCLESRTLFTSFDT